MTYPTEAALAALAANGHEPRRVYDNDDTRQHKLRWNKTHRCFEWKWQDEDTRDSSVGNCHPDDARNAVRCVMLDRLWLLGCAVWRRDDGWYCIRRRGGPEYADPSFVQLYRFAEDTYGPRSGYTATPGEVAVEPEPKGGVDEAAAVLDRVASAAAGVEVRAMGGHAAGSALREVRAGEDEGGVVLKGGAMPTNEEQYEAMVRAKGGSDANPV